MHVGPSLAGRRNAVDGAGRLAVDQDDALVALADLGQIALDDDRFAEQLGEQFDQGVQVLVVRRQVKHSGPAMAEQRLDDDLPLFGPEIEDLAAIGGNQGRRQQGRGNG